MKKIRSIGNWVHGFAPFADSAPNYTIGVLTDVRFGATYHHFWINSQTGVQELTRGIPP